MLVERSVYNQSKFFVPVRKTIYGMWFAACSVWIKKLEISQVAVIRIESENKSPYILLECLV